MAGLRRVGVCHHHHLGQRLQRFICMPLARRCSTVTAVVLMPLSPQRTVALLIRTRLTEHGHWVSASVVLSMETIGLLCCSDSSSRRAQLLPCPVAMSWMRAAGVCRAKPCHETHSNFPPLPLNVLCCWPETRVAPYYARYNPSLNHEILHSAPTRADTWPPFTTVGNLLQMGLHAPYKQKRRLTRWPKH